MCEDLYFHYKQDKVIICTKLQPHLPQKKAEVGGTRMEKQSGVCGYALVAIIKFVNATEPSGLGIIIGCVKL